ncbi:uncharacterized protein M421DRAFT_7150 [Didymella exigua CBS 183.55]|uniref:HTH CENPB-type domain-containing protein n=1 Tax=Didymella exigua CBS 183.55 TaxID=1150837 RepID=A0A6A5RGK3_9PLEO|nr:uncharacterized protein M421DRAFT_7150 [Didymella exigua CBS 183.55]KAF1926214.1 hypothetical protein M421DRAFT_7150 [Didymella exigua CBS 183.55]
MVRDIANDLLAERGGEPVGKHWVDNFKTRPGPLYTRGDDREEKVAQKTDKLTPYGVVQYLEKYFDNAIGTTTRFRSLTPFIFLLTDVVDEFEEDDAVSVDGVYRAPMGIRRYKDFNPTVTVNEKMEDAEANVEDQGGSSDDEFPESVEDDSCFGYPCTRRKVKGNALYVAKINHYLKGQPTSDLKTDEPIESKDINDHVKRNGFLPNELCDQSVGATTINPWSKKSSAVFQVVEMPCSYRNEYGRELSSICAAMRYFGGMTSDLEKWYMEVGGHEEAVGQY